MKRFLISMVFAVLLTVPTVASAGNFYLEGGAGAAFFKPTVYDGTWRQDGIQAPNFQFAGQAYTIGLGYRFSEKWSIQGHRFDWGTNYVKSNFVSDDDYDPINHRCTNPSPAVCRGSYNKVLDRMWGYDLTVTRYFQMHDWADKLEFFVKGGGAVAFHELKWGPGNDFYPSPKLNGAIPMAVVGGGVCYDMLCWDTSLYKGTFSMNGGCLNGGQYDCGYPLSKQVVTSYLMFRYEFGDRK